VRAQPTFCFGRNWLVPINSARKTLAHLRKKIFADRLHAYFIQGLNRKLNSRHRSWNSPDWYFSADIEQLFFEKLYLADNVFFFFTAEKVLFFWCWIKFYNVRRLCFFGRAQLTFCFWQNWHGPIYSARKAWAHLGKKKLFADIDRKKWQSTSAWKDDRLRSKKEASQDDADRTFPNRHHANFIQGLNKKTH